jgi:hypothetical protein
MKTGRGASEEDVRERRERVSELDPALEGNCRAIARQLSAEYGIPVSEKLVRADRDALGLERRLPGRHLTRAELDEQKAYATRRHVEDGATGKEIGAELGISAVAAIRLIPQELRRRSGTRCDEPKPEPRLCEASGCDVIITPTRAQLRNGQGRFCADHFQRSPEKCERTRIRDLERHRKAREQLDQVKRDNDLLDTKQLVERWGVSKQLISNHYPLVGLGSELHKIDGVPFRVYPRAEVERFESHWVKKGQDPRRLANRLQYLKPDFYVMVLEKQGKLERIAERMKVPAKVAKVLVHAKAQERRERLIGHHRGRNVTGIPEDRCSRLARWSEELLADYERRKQDDLLEPGEGPPRQSEIARQAIYEELQEHPGRWSEEYVRVVEDEGVIVRVIKLEMQPRAAKTFLESVRLAKQREKNAANGGQKILAA